MHLKKGDKVVVIAGKEKGKSSTVTRVIPKKGQVILDGLNMATRHRAAGQKGKGGQIVKKAMPIHGSNVRKA
jgi:large subunit ribosomal protein L24